MWNAEYDSKKCIQDEKLLSNLRLHISLLSHFIYNCFVNCYVARDQDWDLRQDIGLQFKTICSFEINNSNQIRVMLMFFNDGFLFNREIPEKNLLFDAVSVSVPFWMEKLVSMETTVNVSCLQILPATKTISTILVDVCKNKKMTLFTLFTLFTSFKCVKASVLNWSQRLLKDFVISRPFMMQCCTQGDNLHKIWFSRSVRTG